MAKEIYLELINVSKSYREIKAVDNLSFSVYKGDIYGFLGPNGAGKSTAIRMLLSLITPDEGQIKIFGRDLQVERNQTLNRVGALIEKPDFYPYLSARKNLEILGKLSHVRNLDHKIEEVLELVKLSRRGESKVKTFSQGMRQRLGIAQTLLHEPDLIVLDEPGNGLDPQGQKEMRNLIKGLNKDKGITIVLSSHILSEIEQIASRMIIINKGKKVVEGDVNELLRGSGMKVKFELSDPARASAVLNNSEFRDKFTITENNAIILGIPRENVPPVSELFIKNDIAIYGIIPAKTLEDYFISKTGNEYPS
ncbi:MAG: ABC transporter ATP-binding protein [bacterium]